VGLPASSRDSWASAFATIGAFLPNQGRRYRPDACNQLKAAYDARIAGQSEQLGQIANTICRHVRSNHRHRPLVILLTGPPGVGKSWTSRVTAQALFSTEALLPHKCEPTEPPCSALLQISAYSFPATTQELRFQQLRERIAAHVRHMPESLIVFEDFDRMDCALRDMLRDVRLRLPTVHIVVCCSHIATCSNAHCLLLLWWQEAQRALGMFSWTPFLPSLESVGERQCSVQSPA
jgi:DNA polymerase III delta prime subunit